jgi:competence protein ComEA
VAGQPLLILPGIYCRFFKEKKAVAKPPFLLSWAKAQTKGGDSPVDRVGKPVSRKIKILVFLAFVVLASVFSLILALLFPDRDDVAWASGARDAAGSGSLATAQAVAATGAATDPAQEKDLIPIYLVGAVQRPGIYPVIRGSYLYELVARAGGLTEDAAADAINLAFQLVENQRIRLPSRQELAAATEAVSANGGDTTITGDNGAGRVNINRASADELDNLPGIGPATARAILAYREQHGRFQKIEDLMQVPGIKESRFSSLKDLICVAEDLTA